MMTMDGDFFIGFYHRIIAPLPFPLDWSAKRLMPVSFPRLLAAMLCLTTLSTGCLLIDNDPGHDPEPGDVSLLWSFSGTSTTGRCVDVPNVKKVRLSVPGLTLPNAGLSACNNAGVDGIILRSLAPGLYNFTVEALDSADQVLYSSSGSFSVDGNKQVSVTLAPIGQQPVPGDVAFRWSFSGTTVGRCMDVPDVKKVRITIPGQTLANAGVYACTNAGVDGVTLLSFAPGTYNYTVEGLDSSNQVRYSGSGSVTVNGNKQVNASLAPMGPRAGDVSFLWSFSGTSTGRCTAVPDVKVRITIPGQTLPNGGVYPCTNGGVDGITLQSFTPGTYSYTVEGLDSSNQVLYSGGGSVTVDGNKVVNVSLTAKSGANSYAYISWTFPANTLSTNPTCAEAGVSWVDVRIDGGNWSRLDCAQGSGGNRVTTPYVTQGEHTVEFIGVGSDSKPYYYTVGTLTTQTGNPISASYRIEAVGSLALRWDLIEGSVAKTCSQAGVTTVTIHLRDEATGTYLYGNTGDSHPCTGAPIIYRYLKPGDYRVYVRGTGSGGFYTNENNNPPTMKVTAFEQKTDADAFTTYLYRQ
jgi:hypothetical protein